MAKIKAHFIDVGKEMATQKFVIEHIPSVGDEIRFAPDFYYKVTSRVWVYDEPECHLPRVNIGIKRIE